MFTEETETAGVHQVVGMTFTKNNLSKLYKEHEST